MGTLYFWLIVGSSLLSRDESLTLAFASPADTPEDLPRIGEDFRTIRERNRTYVDKTQFLAAFLDQVSRSQERNFILTRPPGFGKTTFVDMMASFFRGEKHLFEGTSIYERGNTEAKNGTWIEYPVIDINFGQILDEYLEFIASNDTDVYFRHFWKQRLNKIAAKYCVWAEGTFFLLIRALKIKYKLPVVVLGDEYDRPMDYGLHVVKNITHAEHMQSVARSFMYNIIEEGEKGYIKLAFVVGVQKIDVDQISIPQYRDLTHHKGFASIMGFSQREIDSYFQSSVRTLAKNKDRTPEDIMNELIKRYDGYRFAGEDSETRVFNAATVLESLRKEDLAGNHWYSNHSLPLVVGGLMKENLTVESFDSYSVPRESLYNVDGRTYPLKASAAPISVYMLLHGYLTIKEYDATKDTATLSYANDEVRGIVASRFNAEKDRKIESSTVKGKC